MSNMEEVIARMVQIQDGDFDNPHPNPDHVLGVIYNPILRQVSVMTPNGEEIGYVGDYIVILDSGEMWIVEG